MIIILMLNFQNVVTVLWLCKQLPLLLGNMPPRHEQRDKRGRMSAYNSLKIQEKKNGGGIGRVGGRLKREEIWGYMYKIGRASCRERV